MLLPPSLLIPAGLNLHHTSEMGLRDIESTLPPGFRFFPSDEELVCHYLQKKVSNEGVSEGGTMVEVDLHTREPWELPDVAKLSANEWYFFSFRDRKYATGSRTNRATRSGYWKATGKDRTVFEPRTRAVVGMRKTLVFYSGRAPNGMKTNWVMHEFRLETPHTPPKEDWVLCRVFNKKKGDPTSCSFDNNYSNDQDNNNISSFSPYLESSPPPPPPPPPSHEPAAQQIPADGCYDEASSSFPNNFCNLNDLPHDDGTNSANALLNFAALQYNFFAGFPAAAAAEMSMESARMAAAAAAAAGVMGSSIKAHLGGEEYGMMMMDIEDELMASIAGGAGNTAKDQLFFGSN